MRAAARTGAGGGPPPGRWAGTLLRSGGPEGARFLGAASAREGSGTGVGGRARGRRGLSRVGPSPARPRCSAVSAAPVMDPLLAVGHVSGSVFSLGCAGVCAVWVFFFF